MLRCVLSVYSDNPSPLCRSPRVDQPTCIRGSAQESEVSNKLLAVVINCSTTILFMENDVNIEYNSGVPRYPSLVCSVELGLVLI